MSIEYDSVSEQQVVSRPRSRLPLIVWSILALAAGLLFVYLLFLAPQSVPNGLGHPAVGQPLRDLKLVPLTGGESGLELADLHGKVTLVNYWATWCGPCKIELPHLVKLNQRFSKEADFRLVSVSCGSGSEENLEELRPQTADFLRKAQLSVRTYADLEAASRRALMESAGLKSFGLPTTVLIDRQGKIRALWIGYADAINAEMEQAVELALAEK